MTALIVALVGLALIAALAVAVAWQERRRPADDWIVYGVEESIAYVLANLSGPASTVLTPADVRRMLEWSVRYLQDPSARQPPDAPAIAGGVEAARYVQDRAEEAGFAYDGALVLEVLRLQNEFLATLGAVGPAVDPPGE